MDYRIIDHHVWSHVFELQYFWQCTHLGKLHLIHALTSVPVEESLASEHRGELLGDSLEKLLKTMINLTRQKHTRY